MTSFLRGLAVSALVVAGSPHHAVAQDVPPPEPSSTEATPAAPTPPSPPPESRFRPIYARGIDFTRPSQVAFQGWPPKELIERP